MDFNLAVGYGIVTFGRVDFGDCKSRQPNHQINSTRNFTSFTIVLLYLLLYTLVYSLVVCMESE